MIMAYRLSGFYFLSLGFIREIFATHSDGVSPVNVMRCTLLYILDCMVMYLYLLLFCLFCD
jgi:hypothetical protein